MSHTPGPWEWMVSEGAEPGWSERSWLSGNDTKNGTVLFAPYPCNGQTHSFVYVEEADAHLIAAAPDMEEALEALITAYLTIPGMSGLPVPNREVLHKAQDALMKARGE